LNKQNAEPVIAPLSLLGGYFRLILDMVGRSQEAKCGLKYVIYTFREKIGGSTSERLNEARNEIAKSVTPLYYQK